MIRIGEDTIYGLRLGEETIQKAYLGEVLVWSDTPTDTFSIRPKNGKLSPSMQSYTATATTTSSGWHLVTVPQHTTVSPVSGGSGETVITIATTETSAFTETLEFEDNNGLSASTTVSLVLRPDHPTDYEIWYTSTDGNIVAPFRPESWFDNRIVSNIYTDKGVYTWESPFMHTTGSGWFGKDTLTEVWLPDSMTEEGAENWTGCTSIHTINYGTGLENIQEGAFPPNVTELNFWGETAPVLDDSDSRGNAFRGVRSSGVVHYPRGADYSSFISGMPSNWTAVGDL